MPPSDGPSQLSLNPATLPHLFNRPATTEFTDAQQSLSHCKSRIEAKAEKEDTTRDSQAGGNKGQRPTGEKEKKKKERKKRGGFHRSCLYLRSARGQKASLGRGGGAGQGTNSDRRMMDDDWFALALPPLSPRLVGCSVHSTHSFMTSHLPPRPRPRPAPAPAAPQIVSFHKVAPSTTATVNLPTSGPPCISLLGSPLLFLALLLLCHNSLSVFPHPVRVVATRGPYSIPTSILCAILSDGENTQRTRMCCELLARGKTDDLSLSRPEKVRGFRHCPSCPLEFQSQ